MFKKLCCFIVVLCVILLSGCSPASGNRKITLVLDWTPNTNHTGFFVAKELGYYAEENLEIDIIQPPEGGALSLCAGNKAEFAISFQEEVMMAVNADVPLPIVAIAGLVEHNTSGIISLKEKNITRFKDMENKTYGSWEMPIYDEIVRDCIMADGGNPDTVTFVPNSVTDSIAGIARDFDTVWVYEGWDKIIADIEDIETNFFLFRDINPVFDYYTPVLVTNEQILADGGLTEKFMRATQKGYEYAKNNPAEAAAILLKHAPELNDSAITASQEFLSGQYYSEKWGYIDETRWTAFFEWMKSKELISPTANNKGFKNIEF